MDNILYITYQNYNGGANNNCIVKDINENYGTSINGKEQAIKNYYRNLKRRNK